MQPEVIMPSTRHIPGPPAKYLQFLASKEEALRTDGEEEEDVDIEEEEEEEPTPAPTP